jgi:hypothetical protein
MAVRLAAVECIGPSCSIVGADFLSTQHMLFYHGNLVGKVGISFSIPRQKHHNSNA